ncbi:GHKL domain-containing protein [Anaerostipes hadrus]|uniref:GHKL domain-containing protein n=1 Tax=Anaerostipes hadrus TaxID=649756 RepID=UPI00237BE69D|nr:GHKL domain-containing protein [Anaerostipes hadrus]
MRNSSISKPDRLLLVLLFCSSRTHEHEIKKTDSGFFLSSRRKNCVGTGLKSVTAICKKYDGHLSIETDNHRFKVKMFLQC